MTRHLPALMCLLLAISSFKPARAADEPVAPPQESASAALYDHFIGWYHLPPVKRETRKPLDGPGSLIPLWRRGGSFYTVCRWAEVPLKQSDGNLVWAIAPSSMEGTAIGFDKERGEYFIIHRDAQNAVFDDLYVAGERRILTKVQKPAWVTDHTTPPPHSIADFLGEHYLAWCPAIRMRVTQEKEAYFGQSERCDNAGVWRAMEIEPRQQITPLTDSLGFMLSDRPKKSTRLIYNSDLQRYEMILQAKESLREPVRIPLLRQNPLSPAEGKPAEMPNLNIGIPSYKG